MARETLKVKIVTVKSDEVEKIRVEKTVDEEGQ